MQTWLGNVTLNHLDDVMYPRMTDMAPAPDKLLKTVKCNCKLTVEQQGAASRKWTGLLIIMLVASVTDQRAYELARNTRRRLRGGAVVYDI